jgi:Basic region leucine zipper
MSPQFGCKRKQWYGGSETEPEALQELESDNSSRGRSPPKVPRKTSLPYSLSEEKSADSSACLPGPDAIISAGMLLDLAGSTSAEVRRMTEDERALVHLKRRLRNRESAKRSRARRQATMLDIQAELHDLRELTSSLLDRCVRLARHSSKQSGDIETLSKEKALLESLLRSDAQLPGI